MILGKHFPELYISYQDTDTVKKFNIVLAENQIGILLTSLITRIATVDVLYVDSSIASTLEENILIKALLNCLSIKNKVIFL